MRHVLLALAALSLAFAPLPFPKQQPPGAASRFDLQAMQGAWTERFADSAAVTITGDRMAHTADHAWRTRVGIYRLEGSKLIICWRRQPAGELVWPSSLDPIHTDVWIEVFTPVKP
jgi:hypothetical protein